MYRIPTVQELSNTAFFSEVKSFYQFSAYKNDTPLDTRPLKEVMRDHDYQVVAKGDFNVHVLTSVGKRNISKFDYVEATAQQIVCDFPSTQSAPDLPSRRTPITGQLKLFIDVFSMCRFMKQTDKVLVVGSNADAQKGGNSYMLLAGRVAQVDLYDPNEELTYERTVNGTIFRYFKSEYPRDEAKGYDVVFNDAYKDGKVVWVKLDGVRVFSQKSLTKLFDFRMTYGLEGTIFIYGQLHTGEYRFSNVDRSYLSYNHVGTCAACIEVGYFGGQLTDYEKLILYRCHQSLPCSNNKGILSRKLGDYIDIMAGCVVVVQPFYYLEKSYCGVYDYLDSDKMVSYFSLGELTFCRTVHKRAQQEVDMMLISSRFRGPIVHTDYRLLKGYDLIFGPGYVSIYGDVYATNFGHDLNLNALEFGCQRIDHRLNNIDTNAVPFFESIVIQRFGPKPMLPKVFSREQFIDFVIHKYVNYFTSGVL